MEEEKKKLSPKILIPLVFFGWNSQKPEAWLHETKQALYKALSKIIRKVVPQKLETWWETKDFFFSQNPLWPNRARSFKKEQHPNPWIFFSCLFSGTKQSNSNFNSYNKKGETTKKKKKKLIGSFKRSGWVTCIPSDSGNSWAFDPNSVKQFKDNNPRKRTETTFTIEKTNPISPLLQPPKILFFHFTLKPKDIQQSKTQCFYALRWTMLISLEKQRGVIMVMVTIWRTLLILLKEKQTREKGI